MSTEFSDIKMVGVDAEHIDPDPRDPTNYLYPIKLSSAPDPDWCRLFGELYRKRVNNSMKLSTQIVADWLKLMIADKASAQGQIDVIRTLIADVNVEYRQMRSSRVSKQQQDNRERVDALEALLRRRAEAALLTY